MRIKAELKAKLEQMANEEYRTLTDLAELEFHRIVAARNARPRRASLSTIGSEPIFAGHS